MPTQTFTPAPSIAELYDELLDMFLRMRDLVRAIPEPGARQAIHTVLLEEWFAACDLHASQRACDNARRRVADYWETRE